MSPVYNVVCAIHGVGVARRHNCPLCMADMAKAMAARIRGGEMLREVGASYGLTGERVRQLVASIDPQATALSQAVRRERRRVRAEVERAKRDAAKPPCAVCQGPIERRVRKSSRHPTCSPRCNQLALITRWHLFPEHRAMQEQTVARWRLRNPDKNRSYDMRHAERLLAGTNRRYANPAGVISPKVQAALDEVARLRAKNSSSEVAS